MQPTTTSTERVHLTIDGMSCGHCVAAVSRALEALPGVAVGLVAVGAAALTLDPQAASTDDVIAAIDDAGYQARVAERPLPLSVGTTCCAPASA